MMNSDISSVVKFDTEVLGGSPVFAGTRVPVESLFEHLKAGDTIETYLQDFPSVTRDQVTALIDSSVEMLVESRSNAHSS